MADHTTPIYGEYGNGALLQWETTLRKTLKRILLLPPGFPTDLLHMITGIPSIATMLNEKTVQRLLAIGKAYENQTDIQERQLLRHNLVIMSSKQRIKLGLNEDSSRSEIRNRLHQFKADFWNEKRLSSTSCVFNGG